jgi:hypothetical protein
MREQTLIQAGEYAECEEEQATERNDSGSSRTIIADLEEPG